MSTARTVRLSSLPPSLLAVLGLVLACAGPATPRTTWLLRADVVARDARVDEASTVGIGRIRIAPYLDRAGLVVETAPGRLHEARGHEWAEPLDAGLRSLLADELAAALGRPVGRVPLPDAPWDRTVEVYVDRLHGTMQGTAVLDATFHIVPRDRAAPFPVHRFSRSALLESEGYAALVEAEAGLVRELAVAIARALRAAAAS